jgi:polygalacturonase
MLASLTTRLLASCLVTDFGAVGDGRTDDTAALTRALASCAVPGDVVLPSPGVFLSRPLNVTRAGTRLVVERGARLVAMPASAAAGPDPRWPVVEPLPSYCRGREMPGPIYQPFLRFQHTSNVSLAGGGVIDGSGPGWWKLHDEKVSVSLPYLFFFFFFFFFFFNFKKKKGKPSLQSSDSTTRGRGWSSPFSCRDSR